MKPFERLGEATTPDGRRLTLHRRDADLFVYLDGEELMSTRAPDSEIALAELAIAQLSGIDRPRLLIGGLGLGFTLRAALAKLPAQADVIVVELMPAVVDWNRRFHARVGEALSDRRTTIVERDVAELLDGGRRFHAILLDVDNGPDAWCLDANGRLYSDCGLERIQRSLEPGGVLAVWSAQPDARFLDRLRKKGFRARSVGVRAHAGKGARHTVFVAGKRR